MPQQPQQHGRSTSTSTSTTATIFQDNASAVLPICVKVPHTHEQPKQGQEQDYVEKMEQQIREIVATLCPFLLGQWEDKNDAATADAAQRLTIRPLKGGLSNDIFVVSAPTSSSCSSSDSDASSLVPSSVLLRIHPSEQEHASATASATASSSVSIVDREAENRLSAWLSSIQNNNNNNNYCTSNFKAPLFFGRFRNGRVEEFYSHHATLTYRDMPLYGPQIARLLAHMHQLEPPTHVLPPPKQLDVGDGGGVATAAAVWERIHTWLHLATTTTATTSSSSDKDLQQQQQLISVLQRECTWLQDKLQQVVVVPPQQQKDSSSPSPAQVFGLQTVLTHMDCQSLNLLIPLSSTTTTNNHYNHNDDTVVVVDDDLKLIDYEYASWNPRVVDIGNTFCEYMDLNHLQGGDGDDWPDYPSEQLQIEFLLSYVRETKRLGGDLGGGENNCNHDDDHYDDDDMEFIQELRKLVNQYSLVSHLKWAVWSCVQHGVSNIQYDYLAYGQHRLDAYRYFKQKFFDG